MAKMQSSSSFSSPSVASDRRISVLARHLGVEVDSQNDTTTIFASPTSGSGGGGGGNSVFSHVVRAPEDPILGVRTSFSLLIKCFTFLLLLF